VGKIQGTTGHVHFFLFCFSLLSLRFPDRMIKKIVQRAMEQIGENTTADISPITGIIYVFHLYP
jgi:hypothetical protein